MRPSRVFVSFFLLFSFLLLASVAFPADLKVKVTDPQKAVVAGARVVLYPASSGTAVAVQRTSVEGTAVFSNVLAKAGYRVEVAAPGFAPANVQVTAGQEPSPISIMLAVAARPETVVVSATRTPISEAESATDVTHVDAAELNAMQPTSASDVLRVLPGAIVGDAGQRGGLTSLFVRGGDSRYNKVIVDGVPVNDPGGPFNFGTQSMVQADRMEFVRGAESTLYGSDAMTSVVQIWTRNGTTLVPELRFGAEGGNFETGHGYGSLAGARGRFDYNLFADQFNTNGQGVNDEYSNSSQGANLGVQIAPQAFFRLRTRHSNSRTGVQSFWNFNGNELVPPDTDQYARANDFQASAELSFATSPRLQHRVTGFEYHRHRENVDNFEDAGRVADFGGFAFSFDTPFHDLAKYNRAGLDYQGEYTVRSWATSTFGYHFEDENGVTGYLSLPPLSHGLRRNHAVFGQQILTWRRLSVIGGLRYEHNESFGDKAVPRIAASFLALRGGDTFSGTRFRFAYGTGIKAPTFEESFGAGGFNIVANPNIKPEENRSIEAGVEQGFFGRKLAATATYFNNQFKNQIDFLTLDYTTFQGQYVNVNRSMAHGAELNVSAQPNSRLKIVSGYTYLSSQILDMPLCGAFCNPLKAPGTPFIRRPKHSGTISATWTSVRWGANVGGTFVGRRPDSDFMGLQPPVTYAAGYGRVDFGVWRTINSRMTAYVNVNNALNRHYEEAAGYPAMRANFRAGMRFRVGGE